MRSLSHRFGPALGAVALLGIGYFLGQIQSIPLAAQQPASKGVVPAAGIAQAPAADRRVIAYIYGNTPVTREEFGDYLIQQFGRDRVRLFVNRKIIEASAAKSNIVVTPQEVDAIIEQDCKKLGMDQKAFVANVLRQKYGKTLQEWREDVIKPRLILQHMVRPSIKIEEADLKKIYENMYGEKVVCRVVLWSPNQRDQAFKVYNDIRNDEKAFDDAARSQISSDLAARAGIVDPIGRNSGPGTAKIEEIAFRLKDGQLSELIDTPGGIMVIKRVQSIPARTEVVFEKIREALTNELRDRLMDLEVPKMFARINDEAKPHFILSPGDETTKEAEEKSKRLGADAGALERK